MRRRILLVAAILTVAAGVSPRSVIAELYTPENVANAAVPVLDAYWAQVFAARGLVYTSPHQVRWYNTSVEPSAVRTGCGDAPVMNAINCPADASIYLDYAFFWEQLDNHGDFALAMIISHEWAHHIERLVGYVKARDGVVDQLGEFYSIQVELLADCWAGSAAVYMNSLGMLDPGDLEEGYETVLQMGDEHFGGADSPLAATAHGTSDQRLVAFVGGYSAADPGACPGMIDRLLG